MAKTHSELVPGTLDMLVLRALVTGPMHGYAIARHLQQVSDDVLRVEEGSLYPALHRMQRRGWVDAAWGRSEANRRAKYYDLTDAGRGRLAERVVSWRRMVAAIGAVLDSPPRARPSNPAMEPAT